MSNKPVRTLRQFFGEMLALPLGELIGFLIVTGIFFLGAAAFVSGLANSYENGPARLSAPPSLDAGTMAD